MVAQQIFIERLMLTGIALRDPSYGLFQRQPRPSNLNNDNSG